MVLEVEQLHAGMAERQLVASAEGVEEPVLDDPVDLAIQLQRIVLDRR